MLANFQWGQFATNYFKISRYFEHRSPPCRLPLYGHQAKGMTRIKAAAMALATACLLAGCSATASQQVPRTEPQGEGYNVGQGGIKACTAPGRQGECSMVKNVRLMLLSGTWVDGIGSFYKEALPDQTEVWVRGVDLLGLKAKGK